MRRYYVDFPIDPPATSGNDFVEDVLQLRSNDDGIWRVSVSAQLQVVAPESWDLGHLLELRLYKNGEYDRLIDSVIVDSTVQASGSTVLLRNETLIKAVDQDILQVRLFSRRPTGATYEVQLTGESETNWVSFERVGD